VGATVLGFADEVNTDAISAANEGGGVSVGASLLPEPDTALGSETHDMADMFAEDVKMDGESLADTLQALRVSIAAVDPEHPSTVSLQRIDELNWTEGMMVNGDLIPHQPHPGFSFYRVGSPIKPWEEGPFVNIYANDILSSDADGGRPRRLLREVDPSAVGSQGPQGERGGKGEKRESRTLGLASKGIQEREVREAFRGPTGLTDRTGAKAPSGPAVRTERKVPPAPTVRTERKPPAVPMMRTERKPPPGADGEDGAQAPPGADGED
jgi:hypothetical protein